MATTRRGRRLPLRCVRCACVARARAAQSISREICCGFSDSSRRARANVPCVRAWVDWSERHRRPRSRGVVDDVVGGVVVLDASRSDGDVVCPRLKGLSVSTPAGKIARVSTTTFPARDPEAVKDRKDFRLQNYTCTALPSELRRFSVRMFQSSDENGKQIQPKTMNLMGNHNRSAG
ncbi:hypothetical protein [Oryza sativa Japonica Group]|uniref:Uncharacterized protein n=1 Tax=Oryza sativa subsp. japonica TaxID=39947 RepID=Q8LJH7_ORYSJ|nr:hypothetical protein [Oryza sativa Japonica Group]